VEVKVDPDKKRERAGDRSFGKRYLQIVDTFIGKLGV
jgi:hypothetical protein